MEEFYKITSGSLYDRFKIYREEQSRQFEALKQLFEDKGITTTLFSFELTGKNDGEHFKPSKNKIRFSIKNNKDDFDKFKDQITKATHYESYLLFKQSSDMVNSIKQIANENDFVYYSRPCYIDLVGFMSGRYRFFFDKNIMYFSLSSDKTFELEFNNIDEYKEVTEDEFWEGLNVK